MHSTVEIFLWGKRIGILHQELNGSYAETYAINAGVNKKKIQEIKEILNSACQN